MELERDQNKELALTLLQERDDFYRLNYQLREELKKHQSSSFYTSLQSTIEKQVVQLQEKDDQIASLLQRIEWLERKIWGKSSEKVIAPDPAQRRIDFDGLDILPEEQALATSAQEEISAYKVTVKRL